MAEDLTCTDGQIAISELITGVNERIGADEYATDLIGGTIKVKLDETNPANVILYMTNDGTAPGA